MLFNRNNVSTADTSVMLPRWAQDGCTLVNIYANKAFGTHTLQSVTAGKTIYITNMTINFSTSFPTGFSIKDNATTIFNFPVQTMPQGSHTFNFDTPLAFDTSIVLTIPGGAADTMDITLCGWEE